MSQWRVEYTDEAERDLSDIYSYIAYSLLSPDNADAQVERIMQAVEELDHMPLRCNAYAIILCGVYP
ncbi:MAG: type II toxin-antitoxin system RelE/ParE family toxin [Eubacteriales bacterium]|nr:type II toxin-antitoxin system RelE/ParE family toxin [Eubacteriales bacterium]